MGVSGFKHCFVTVLEVHTWCDGYIHLICRVDDSEKSQREKRSVTIHESIPNRQPAVGDSICIVGKEKRQRRGLHRIQVTRGFNGLAYVFTIDTPIEELNAAVESYYTNGIPRIPQMNREYYDYLTDLQE